MSRVHFPHPPTLMLSRLNLMTVTIGLPMALSCIPLIISNDSIFFLLVIWTFLGGGEDVVKVSYYLPLAVLELAV